MVLMPNVNYVIPTIVLHVKDLLHIVLNVQKEEMKPQHVNAQWVNMKMTIRYVKIVHINVLNVLAVPIVNVFVPKIELEILVTAKITSLIMVLMLNVNHVPTDVHNVLTVPIVKLVMVIEYLTPNLVTVHQDGMKFVVIKMV